LRTSSRSPHRRRSRSPHQARCRPSGSARATACAGQSSTWLVWRRRGARGSKQPAQGHGCRKCPRLAGTACLLVPRDSLLSAICCRHCTAGTAGMTDLPAHPSAHTHTHARARARMNSCVRYRALRHRPINRHDLRCTYRPANGPDVSSIPAPGEMCVLAETLAATSSGMILLRACGGAPLLAPLTMSACLRINRSTCACWRLADWRTHIGDGGDHVSPTSVLCDCHKRRPVVVFETTSLCQMLVTVLLCVW